MRHGPALRGLALPSFDWVVTATVPSALSPALMTFTSHTRSSSREEQ